MLNHVVVFVSVCEIDGPREAVEAVAICLRNLSGTRGRFCRTDGIEWRATFLHRKSRERVVVAKIAHLFQSVRFAALQIVRAIGGKDELCHRRNGRIWARVESLKSAHIHL